MPRYTFEFRRIPPTGVVLEITITAATREAARLEAEALARQFASGEVGPLLGSWEEEASSPSS